MRGRTIRVHTAHMPGHCALTQTPSGTLALSSGPDAIICPHDIRPTPSPTTQTSKQQPPVWWSSLDRNPSEPDIPEITGLSDVHDKPVTALAASPDGNTLATASHDGFVRLFTLTPPPPRTASDTSVFPLPSATLAHACARFAAPVRAIAFSPTGGFLAAAGDEPGLVKIIMVAQPLGPNILRAAESSPAFDAVTSLAFDPRGDVVVTLSERGVAAVWGHDQCKLLRVVDLNKRKPSSLAWAPDGGAIVFATEKGAVVASRQTWCLDYLLQDVADAGDDDDEDGDGLGDGGAVGADSNIFSKEGRQHITAVAWSPNGRYVLTASKDCNVALWDVHHRKVLARWKAQQHIQQIAWHVTTNAFLVVDTSGQWGIVPDVVPAHMPSPHSDSMMVELPSLPDDPPPSKGRKRAVASTGDVQDEEDEAVVKRSKAKVKRQRMLEKKKKAKEDAEKKKKDGKSKIVQEESKGDGEDDDGQELENDFKVSLSDVEADDEDDVNRAAGSGSDPSDDSDDDSDSDEEVPGELADLENGGVHLPELKGGTGRRRRKRDGKVGRVVVPAAQTAFMPSATPLSEKASRRARILVWNLVGTVVSFDESTHDVVEVQFADASLRSIGIKDHFGYTCGCLSQRGVFLASGKTKDHASVVMFRPFNSWATQPEWTQFMPEGEDISVIALGGLFAAVVTTPNNLVRIFSLAGIQTVVWAAPGPVVSTTACGEYLAVVYCAPGSGTLRVEMLEVSAVGEVEGVLYDGVATISSGASLEWLGFTNDSEELCLYDSAGWLWILTDLRRTKRWMPVVQGAAAVLGCDWFWAASVTSEQLIGAACLSNERFPPAKTRPALRPVPLAAPAIERVTRDGKATVAERLLRTRMKLVRATASRALVEEEAGGNAENDEDVEAAEEEVARVELEVDKCLLNMMQTACQHEQNTRALDLATKLNCRVSFRYAIELANHFKREELMKRVEQVVARKLEVMDAEDHARNAMAPTPVPAGRLGMSPVSMMNGGGMGVGHETQLEVDEDGDGGKGERFGTVGRTKHETKLDLSDKEAESGTGTPRRAKATMPKGNSKRSGTAKGEKPVDLLDVTDDEAESAELEGAAHAGASEEMDSGTKMVNKDGQEDSRGKKRKAAATTQSQASEKDEAKRAKDGRASDGRAKNVDAPKKQKTEIKRGVAKTTPAKFVSFTNRFLKK